MFKKKAEEELDPKTTPPDQEQDEHAYEDSWYRALKAQAQRPADGEGTAKSDED